MKKYLFIFVIAVFLLLTLSVKDNINPPYLSISSGDVSIMAVTGNYVWTEDSISIEVDTDNPTDIVKYQQKTLVVNSGDVLNLVFKKNPVDVQVNIWKNNKIIEQELYNNKLIVPYGLGDLVYEVIVNYDQGTVHYAFVIIVNY